MSSEKTERKYMPEVSAKEIQELRNTIQRNSQTVIADNIARMKKADPKRPFNMMYFDEIANLFGRRQGEIAAEKAKGKKVIGYTCLFAPTELILAADAIPVRVNSGWYDTSKLGDRVVPVEVCPVIRSTIGAKMIELSPFLRAKRRLNQRLNLRWNDKTQRNTRRQQTSLANEYSKSQRCRSFTAVLE